MQLISLFWRSFPFFFSSAVMLAVGCLVLVIARASVKSILRFLLAWVLLDVGWSMARTAVPIFLAIFHRSASAAWWEVLIAFLYLWLKIFLCLSWASPLREKIKV